jgi:hypothetical protein
MNVGQVIELAREWVETEGSQTPGFCGAHLMGALNHAPRDAPFPAYKDVDLNLVVEGAPGGEPHEIFFKGLILEYGVLDVKRYRSPATVLSDPELASNLAVDSILSDPKGTLAALQSVVAREYAQRRWVQARCASAKNDVLQGFQGLQLAASPDQARLILWLYVTMGLTGTVALADLKPPTHRRSLIQMKTLLEQYGREDLQEAMLELLGFAHLRSAQVEVHLHNMAEAFDRAVQVTRTPVPGSFKLHPHVRPYLVDGAQEMIDESHGREAMLWIWFGLAIANGAIQADAPEDEKPHFQAMADQLYADMGWSGLQDVASHLPQARKLADELFRVADAIVAGHPDIADYQEGDL